MKRYLLPLATLVSLGACGLGTDRRDESATPADPGIEEAPPSDSARTPPAAPGGLISPEGIGEARSGMTMGDLRAALPPGTMLGPAEPFMVDVDGLPVVRGADTLYYVLVGGGEPTGDDAPVTTVATRNETFRTAEGVGPGMTIADASAVYGAATLSFNTNDESREHVSFAGYPHGGVRFRVGAGPEGFSMAGTYATQGEYNETTAYDAAARITLVSVALDVPATE